MIYTLLLSCLITATSCNRDSYKPSASDNIKDKGDVTIYTTTNTRSQDFTKGFIDFSTKFNMSPNTITLDPTQKFQTMDGFGAAITGSTCYNLMKMSKEDRTKFLTETFSDEKGMGMNYIRIAIGCSDFSLSEYTCWDKEGKENFALQFEEKQYILPVLKEILAINPSIKIMGSPWTPPKWMKVNNLTDLKPFDSWKSGQLNPKHYQDYGWYFVQWLQAMKKEGITVSSITVQNEPLNRGNSASLYMTWQEQQAFIKQALGPQLKAAALETKIYAFDHNYNYDNIADQNDYPVKIYNDAGAASYIAGAAFHNYGGDKAELLDIHNQRPDKELVFTETSIGEWNEGRNLEKRLMEDMREVALGTVNNWSRAVIVWNLMLDTDKGPNREGGCQTCYGAVDISKSNFKNITRNSHYYIVGHLSSVVKSGAVRIGAKGYTAEGLVYTAFQNKDGSYAIVLLNDAEENRKITISDSKNHFSYEVPAKSVVSYRWAN
ncbi:MULTISPECIES: glycoside hydrolase family 30 protein [unclassified Sphingobacterium]|uniref:glycoside hydrolase family 30 protein n=1 Tax=unclassified Sphingobacterium TaxID=2609468 RepID=UPI0014399A7E|nr:glycoside hydrolase family 30 beta sandwich domain-containing protein [Sphingobacterium sp. B16(2022)]NJI74815.1 glucosylceramidase [Sphingobacterium sp. B16(2022)]